MHGLGVSMLPFFLFPFVYVPRSWFGIELVKAGQEISNVLQHVHSPWSESSTRVDDLLR